MNIVARIKSACMRESSFFMALPAFIWQLIFLYVPLIFVIVASFMKVDEKLSLGALTLEHYASFTDPLYWVVIGRSLLLAMCAAIACGIMAYPVAYYIALRATRWKNVLLFFLILPFWINLLVQVYAWFFVLEKNGLVNTVLLKLGIIAEPLRLLNTPFAIFIVMLYCYLPFMAMPIYSILERFNQRLIEASLDLGATPWQTFMRVTLPMSLPGLKTGFFLVFVPSFGEFVIPVLTGGGKKLFVGSMISLYYLDAGDTQLGAAFTMLSGVVLLIVSLFLNWLFKRIVRVSAGGQ